MSHDAQDLIATARKRLEQVRQAEDQNRAEAKIDLEFLTLQQWDTSIKTARQNASPPRPCITADRLTAFWNQVTNEIRKAQPAPYVAPRGNGASKETAQVYEGKIRAILYDSDSQLALAEAAKYAVGCGTGAIRLDPEMVDAESGQQELRINPVYDPSTVYWDPFAKRPDKSDARWCLVVDIMSRAEYREQFGTEKLEAHQDFTARNLNTDWFDPRGDGDAVMIAEYWCVEKPGSMAIALDQDEPDDREATLSLAPHDWIGAHARKVGRSDDGYRVVRHLIDGVQELESAEMRPGRIIPILAVEGNALMVEGKRYVSSLIRGARDSQVIYNWLATKKIEMLANRSNAPYLLTPTQIQNHERQWQDAPNENATYLKYNPDPLMPGPPIRNDMEAPVQAITESQVAEAQQIKDIIGIQDPNLGSAQYANQSGTAIAQLRTEGDTSTYHFTDNLSRTLKVLGKMLVTWIPYYYDLEQEMRIMNADMTESMVLVNNAPGLGTPGMGAPGMGAPGMGAPGMGAPGMGAPGSPGIFHDLTKGNYECVIEVGPGYDTARQQDAVMYQNLIQANPSAFQVIGDLAVRYRDTPGADEAADRIKRWIGLTIPGLIPNEQNGPAQLQAANAQVQQMQAQIQQLTQQMQQMGIALKTQAIPKQIEAQSRIQAENIKAHATLLKAAIDAHTKMRDIALRHGHAMYDTELRESTDAIEHLMQMLQNSEFAPSGPGTSSSGPSSNPSGLPIPMPPGTPGRVSPTS